MVINGFYHLHGILRGRKTGIMSGKKFKLNFHNFSVMLDEFVIWHWILVNVLLFLIGSVT